MGLWAYTMDQTLNENNTQKWQFDFQKKAQEGLSNSNFQAECPICLWVNLKFCSQYIGYLY